MNADFTSLVLAVIRNLEGYLGSTTALRVLKWFWALATGDGLFADRVIGHFVVAVNISLV